MTDTAATADSEPAPPEIDYETEPVTPDQALLASWHGTASDETLRLSGPCPACGHDAPNIVPRKVSALELAPVPAGPARLTVRLNCTCQHAHAGQPDTLLPGCGRSWMAVATTEAGAVTLAPTGRAPTVASTGAASKESSGSAATDPAEAARQAELAAAAQAIQSLGKSQVESIRGAAEKWIGGITALFGLFGLAGVTLTRDTVTALDIPWQVVVALAGLAAVGLAGWSVFLIYRAAYGWPATIDVSTDDKLLAWYQRRQAEQFQRAERMAQRLRAGVRAAAGAVAAVVVTAGVLWFGPQQPTASLLTRATLTNGSVVCGTLLPGTIARVPVIRRASDGTAIPIPLRTLTALTAVASC